MTEKEVRLMLEEVGVPVHYDHAKKGQTLPYITYNTTTDNFFADDKVQAKVLNLSISLYTSNQRDLMLEEKIETILNDNSIPWNRDETYLVESNVYIEIYEMEV